MRRNRIAVSALALLVSLPAFTQQPGKTSAQKRDAGDRAWIERSNVNAQLLLDLQFKYGPEGASRQGLAKFDTEIARPTEANREKAKQEGVAALAELKKRLAVEKDERVKQDLEILIKTSEQNLKGRELADKFDVPFINATAAVFGGVQGLLDDQVAAERRQAAVVRMRKYAGMEDGYTPIAQLFEERVKAQMAKPGVIYPPQVQIKTALARNTFFIDGLQKLCQKYQLQGWEEPYAKLKEQLAAYDNWVTTAILPKARSDFRLPPEEYAFALEQYGIDIPPDELAAIAHRSFTEIQEEMQVIATRIAKERGWEKTGYRDVIRELKKDQITGDAILPYYKETLGKIEEIIRKQRLVSLPDRPAQIRIATLAESAQQPAPHMEPPPLLNNTGQKGTFVLPLNMPAAPGSSQVEKVDDYTFGAGAWTLIAHEARPGHELQFDSMVERGVSTARALYAFNSTNVEGWGLYSEYITKPYMPLDGQLISLQLRLMRAARAFLDPELQSGKVQPADAMRVLTQDVVLSNGFANQEVERYTFRSPGQATSYFYGYIRLLQLRKDVEKALGPKFDQMKFHDFILAQGLLSPDQMRHAVFKDFVGTNAQVHALTVEGDR